MTFPNELYVLGLLVIVILMVMRYRHNKRMEELNQVSRFNIT